MRLDPSQELILGTARILRAILSYSVDGSSPSKREAEILLKEMDELLRPFQPLSVGGIP